MPDLHYLRSVMPAPEVYALEGPLISEEELWHCSKDFMQILELTTILHYLFSSSCPD